MALVFLFYLSVFVNFLLYELMKEDQKNVTANFAECNFLNNFLKLFRDSKLKPLISIKIN